MVCSGCVHACTDCKSWLLTAGADVAGAGPTQDDSQARWARCASRLRPHTSPYAGRSAPGNLQGNQDLSGRQGLVLLRRNTASCCICQINQFGIRANGAVSGAHHQQHLHIGYMCIRLSHQCPKSMIGDNRLRVVSVDNAAALRSQGQMVLHTVCW